MNIGKVLEERRSALGLSQSALAQRLERYGVSVTKHAVTKWEAQSTDDIYSQVGFGSSWVSGRAYASIVLNDVFIYGHDRWQC